ncbi:hypothetical protein Esi_0383_0011 [Ectocarpus siliculosus]|uniref:Uncharacterized protein n=1 Tax=Ectocarpus siliculosus TaxID=2880 RepID=D7FZR5_ECTSI|nr:hypothetical protein Esi_0383_0011 [Ectocarpus siliculosus]|eukprot:CBJ32872.1 hypothetical protein Esi_0383_0011 [Ectocarpus siliculosus]
MRPRTSNNQVRAFVDDAGIANQFPALNEPYKKHEQRVCMDGAERATRRG